MGKSKFTLLSILAILLIGGCKSDQNGAADTDADFVIRMAKQAEQINPILFPSPIAREIYQYIFTPIAEIDPDNLELVPLLIKAINPLVTHEDGSYTLEAEILEEAKWDDGTPITGADYAFTLKSILHPATDASSYKYMKEIINDVLLDEANPKKFTIVFDDYSMDMKESALTFELLPQHIYDPENITKTFTLRDLADTTKLATLSQDSTFMRFATELNGPKYTREIISGSGPYAFVEWKDNEAIILERKANYWAKDKTEEMFHANPAKIIFVIIPDETAAITQMAAGNVDLINSVTVNTYETFQDSVKGKGNISWLNVQLPKFYVYLLNHKDKMLQDKNVRKALQAINNTDEYIKTFENGNATKLTSFVPSFLPGYNKDIKNIGGQLDLATKYLKEADWEDTNANGTVDKVLDGKKEELKLQMLVSGDLSVKFGLLFKEQCAKAGIELDVVRKDFPLVRKENMNTRNYQIIPTLFSVELILENPFDTYHSSNIETTNISSYTSAEADSLINIITSVENDATRIAAHKKLQEEIYDDAVMIYLYAPIDRIALSDKWEGKASLSRPGYRANTFTLSKN
ncbi:MAG: ABC transporter substrate-binding protein [Saprospiraceae bacterium]